jgi:hypothetical protein
LCERSRWGVGARRQVVRANVSDRSLIYADAATEAGSLPCSIALYLHAVAASTTAIVDFGGHLRGLERPEGGRIANVDIADVQTGVGPFLRDSRGRSNPAPNRPFSWDRSAWLKVIHHLMTPAWESIQPGTWSADMV